MKSRKFKKKALMKINRLIIRLIYCFATLAVMGIIPFEKTYSELAAQHEGEYRLPNLAWDLKNWGIVDWSYNRYSEAEANFKKALKIYKELPAENRDRYLRYAADVLVHLGDLYQDKNEHSEAEASYKEALEIYRELIAKNQNVHLFMIMALNKLGTFYQKKDEYSEAETYYKEALKIRRELAAKNQDAYLPHVAVTLDNLGILYQKKNKYSEAEIFYMETLEIWRKLATKNRDEYLPDVAMTLNKLGDLYQDKNEHSKAEASYMEALRIGKELAVRKDVYFGTLVSLSTFYLNSIPNKELSLQYAKEATEILGKCRNTSYLWENIDKAKRVIEAWDNKE